MAQILKIKEWMLLRNDYIHPLMKVRKQLDKSEMNKDVYNYCKNELESVAEKLGSLIAYIEHKNGKLNINWDDDFKSEVQYLPAPLSINNADNKDIRNFIQYYNYIIDKGNYVIYLFSKMK